MEEKRKHARINKRATVSLTSASELGVEQADLGWRASFCSARDYSLGGVRLELHDHLPEESRVKLEIALEHPDEVFTRMGKVAWVRSVKEGFSYAVGIAFVDVNGGRSKAWHDALMSRYGQWAVAG